jgi:hypothetical protein
MKLRALAALAALAATGATLLFTSSALAVEPAELKQGFSVAGLIGFGAGYEGFDLGVRGGYTLPNNIYLGGTILLNVGFGGWGAGFTTGFEGGYQFAAGPVVVRPYGGIGVVLEQYNYGNGANQACAADPSACAIECQANPGLAICNGAYGGGSTSSFAFWVGGTAIYDFKGGPWFVAADIRTGDAPLLYGSGGFIFAFLPSGGYEF